MKNVNQMDRNQGILNVLISFLKNLGSQIRQNIKIIIIHVSVWLIVFGFNYVFLYNSFLYFDVPYHLKIWSVYIISFYLNYLFLMPVFFFRKKMIAYVAGFMILFGSSYLLNEQISSNQSIGVIRLSGQIADPGFPLPGQTPGMDAGRVPGPGPAPGSVTDPSQLPVFSREYISQPDLEKMFRNGQFNWSSSPMDRDRKLLTLYGLLILFFSSFSLRFLLKFSEDEKRGSLIEKERISTELTFLKQQINPHFLFNSLNNIYSLSMNKPDIAPDAIVKLSSILRHMLYEAEKSQVFLKDEIKIIQDYIDLQKMRLKDMFPITYEINGDPEDGKIEPFILIPLVENAFKYGVDNVNETFININITISSGKLKFNIKNKKLVKHVSLSEHSGIGIKNIKRRLDLLYYNNHVLEITDEEDDYSILLELPIKE